MAETGTVSLQRGQRVRAGLATFVQIAGIMAVTAFAAFLVRPARGEISGALIFVLGITLAGSRFGLRAGLAAAMASFLLYNFYFAEPVATFRFDTLADIVPLAVFNLSAVVAGVLSGRLRDQAEATASANHSLTTLLTISQDLQSALSFTDIERTLVGQVSPLGVRFLGSGTVGPANASSPVRARVTSEGADEGDDPSQAIYRIDCGRRSVRLAVAAPSPARPAETMLGSAAANLIALAMERAVLAERIAETEAAARAQELRSSLLSSISHDFRTPLTTISASASSLLSYRDKLAPDVAEGLLRSILSESERLNRFTANLLEMTKLESGHQLPQEIVSVSDVLGAAVRRIRPRAGSRRFERVGAPDCLIVANPELFELALLNILENSVLYSDDATRIRITLSTHEGLCCIEIADEGRGIPPAAIDRVFDRFYRVEETIPHAGGSGLGLAIAQGFVRACGGSIRAAVPGIDGHGSLITISVPLAPEPAA